MYEQLLQCGRHEQNEIITTRKVYGSTPAHMFVLYCWKFVVHKISYVIFYICWPKYAVTKYTYMIFLQNIFRYISWSYYSFWNISFNHIYSFLYDTIPIFVSALISSLSSGSWYRCQLCRDQLMMKRLVTFTKYREFFLTRKNVSKYSQVPL